jgi:hypothetical protein
MCLSRSRFEMNVFVQKSSGHGNARLAFGLEILSMLSRIKAVAIMNAHLDGEDSSDWVSSNSLITGAP